MPRSFDRISLRVAGAFAAGIATIVVLDGCASRTRPQPAATAPHAPADPALAKAQAECTDKAVRETETVSPQTQASKVAITIYAECMKQKGFPLHPAPGPTPAGAR